MTQTTPDSEALAAAVFESVQKYVADEVARAVAPLLEQMKALPAGPQGEPGQAGKDGQDGAPGRDGAPGEPGADGAPGAPGADGPAGKDGADGRDGKDGPFGADGAPGEKGERGADGQAGQDGRHGKDGAPGEKGEQGDAGMDGMPGAPGADGRDGRDGRDGEPGRDAADIEVLDSIDERKSYRRGTFATHKGGLWRAADTTDRMDGWVCITRGVDREEEVAEDGGRVIKRRTLYSDGQVFEREIKTTAMVYRGLYAEERGYDVGDVTTWGGSVWHCEAPTSDRPGEGSKAWRLAVKKGAPGKDAKL